MRKIPSTTNSSEEETTNDWHSTWMWLNLQEVDVTNCNFVVHSTKEILCLCLQSGSRELRLSFQGLPCGAKTKISESLQMSCVTDIACMFKNSRIWHHALYRTPETPGGSMSLEWIYGSNCMETDDYIKATRSFWGRPRVGVGGLLAFSSWSHWNQQTNKYWEPGTIN